MKPFPNSASLIEPGTRQFLFNTLQRCKRFKEHRKTKYTNIITFIVLIVVFGGLIWYKRMTRMTSAENEDRRRSINDYLMEKVRTYNRNKPRDTNSYMEIASRTVGGGGVGGRIGGLGYVDSNGIHQLTPINEYDDGNNKSLNDIPPNGTTEFITDLPIYENAEADADRMNRILYR